MNTTYITGFWYIKDNKKNDWAHYNRHLYNTMKILKDCNIIIFYEDNNVLELFKKNIQSHNVLYRKIPVQDLKTYKISNDYLNSCKNQNNKYIKNINTHLEKGLIHYNREYIQSGEESFRKVFTIWTSKIYLLEKIKDENPFKTDYFAWIDISASRYGRPINLYTKKYNVDKMFYFKNGMKYYGITIPINASFFIAHKNIWNKILPLYDKEIENNKDLNYAHDEETLFYLIWKDNKHLFSEIKY